MKTAPIQMREQGLSEMYILGNREDHIVRLVLKVEASGKRPLGALEKSSNKHLCYAMLYLKGWLSETKPPVIKEP